MASKKGRYTDNPCVVLDYAGKPHLNVFLNFFYEERLPKWKTTQERKELANISLHMSEGDGTNQSPSDGSHTSSPYRYAQQMSASLNHEREMTKWGKIKSWIKEKGKKKADKSFVEMKERMRQPNTTEEIDKAKETAETLYELLDKSGQYEQAKKVAKYISVLAGEISLSKQGITKYLLEDDVIEFMLKSEKGVRIDFLRSYSEILPLDVAKKKIDADKLMVFDNYCVMFYDPNIAAFRFVEDIEEERKRRDPILFGMIEGSNKLYYICDWVFKDDDLTMAKVEETIGRHARDVEKAEIMGVDFSINELERMIDNMRSVIADASEQR